MNELADMTVGDLRKLLEGVPDSTPAWLLTYESVGPLNAEGAVRVVTKKEADHLLWGSGELPNGPVFVLDVS